MMSAPDLLLPNPWHLNFTLHIKQVRNRQRLKERARETDKEFMSGPAAEGGLTLARVWTACSLERTSRRCCHMLFLSAEPQVPCSHGYLCKHSNYCTLNSKRTHTPQAEHTLTVNTTKLILIHNTNSQRTATLHTQAFPSSFWPFAFTRMFSLLGYI